MFDEPIEEPRAEHELEDAYLEVMQNSAAARRGYDTAKSLGLDENSRLKAALIAVANPGDKLPGRPVDHSAGPWFVDCNHNRKVMGIASPARRHDLDFVCTFGDSAREEDINLIVLSPEMLAAIQGAMRIVSLWMPPDGENSPEHDAEFAALAAMRNQFRDLIKRAEGSPGVGVPRELTATMLNEQDRSRLGVLMRAHPNATDQDVEKWATALRDKVWIFGTPWNVPLENREAIQQFFGRLSKFGNGYSDE